MNSFTPSGNLIALAGFVAMIANHYQINVAQSDIVAVLGAIAVLYGVIHSWVVAYRNGHITKLGMMKKM